VADIAGRSVALRYTSIEIEYAALHRSAILVDRSHRTRMTFEGDQRADTLTGLVTNDIGALTAGSGLYAAALTPRGKIIADVRVFARETDLLIDVPVRAAAGWVAMVRKYVNPRTTRYADHSESLADLGVFGVRARSIVGAAVGLSGETLAALAPYAHAIGTLDGNKVLVARVPDIGIEGYELILPVESRPLLWRRALELGAVPAGLDTWEIARIEAGRPEWGIDIDDTTIPQEANFDELDAISYTKGCYIGQEVVARVHFRGHVNRHLRGLRAASSEAPPTGAQLIDDAGNHVGDVRSSVASPRLGGIALGMVRREVALGASLNAKWEGGERRVDVTTLPFPA
jgi:folate-binding protein YgfZ